MGEKTKEATPSRLSLLVESLRSLSLNGEDPLQKQILIALLLALRKVGECDFEQARQLLEIAVLLLSKALDQRGEENLEEPRTGSGP